LKLREAALNFLARREHSRAELARKLVAYGETGEIDAVLDDLEKEGLLSSARFAESLAASRRGRHGSLRLRHELREKGVPEPEAERVMAEARARDLDDARAVWRKKFGHPPADAAERARQMRFLAGRGFPAEVIRRVVGGDED
jgi:regulatory protein